MGARNPHIWFFIRLRDAISGNERWARDANGAPLRFAYRQNADLAALNETRSGTTWEYAFVVEIDDRYEEVGELAA